MNRVQLSVRKRRRLFLRVQTAILILTLLFRNPLFTSGHTPVNMLNGDTGFLYTKQIRILTAKATPARQALLPSQTTLSLLPEGGDLVEGIACTVAFKATNERGLPVTVSGSVTDNTGAKVADLKTLFNGMGSFTLLPQPVKRTRLPGRQKR
jgi:hypothetical protein